MGGKEEKGDIWLEGDQLYIKYVYICMHFGDGVKDGHV